MAVNIPQVEKEIATLQAKIDKERARLAKLTPTQVIADRLHTMVCRSNHMDACGWDWEQWENVKSGQTKYRYLERAKEIEKYAAEKNLSVDNMFEIFELARGIY